MALSDLSDLARDFAVRGPPASPDEVEALLRALRERLGDGHCAIAVPPLLRRLWAHAREWHALREHCEVFGLNFYPPSKLVSITDAVFGDDECRRDWAEQVKPQQGVSCAEPGWLCFGAFSEYDYLFTCMDAGDESFGAVRSMVNNCGEEAGLTLGLAAAAGGAGAGAEPTADADADATSSGSADPDVTAAASAAAAAAAVGDALADAFLLRVQRYARACAQAEAEGKEDDLPSFHSFLR